MEKGELSKYRKKPSSSAMVVTPALWQIIYINVVFAKVDDVTKGRSLKEYEEKKKRVEEIK